MQAPNHIYDSDSAYYSYTSHEQQQFIPDPLPPNGTHTPMTIKIPARSDYSQNSLRRSSRNSAASTGSEYHEGDEDDEDEDAPGEPDEDEYPAHEAEEEMILTQHGRRVKKLAYVDSPSSDQDDYELSPKPKKEQEQVEEDGADSDPLNITTTGRPRRKAAALVQHFESDDSDDIKPPGGAGRRTRSRNQSFNNLGGFLEDDEPPKRNLRPRIATRGSSRRKQESSSGIASRPLRKNDRAERYQKRHHVDNDYDPDNHEPSSPDADGLEDVEIDMDEEDLSDDDDDGHREPKKYSLRARKEGVNYAILPPLEAETRASGSSKRRGGTGGSYSRKRAPGEPGWSATGAELGRWMGMPPGNPIDSSDDEYTRTPRKGLGGAPVGGLLGAAGLNAGMMGDLTAGTPSNLGKIGDTSLADVDPLGVNPNVTFDEVGGLDDHIHSLKEMTLLPLLYPEVFQRFKVTPPRGVLFHGPPGTGKTLLARALAASARTDGRKISFFMRKGADCLSKWVGEAERQLRLLFEEARAQQPSIIFFDEIDGLAPVRSSKQDQIHASIVSTLLALMDGMDGRGQVVVIGATNRPDAVDPALRRPGRFDREFYFGLPNLEARQKILSIMTKDWAGWSNDAGKDKLNGLAKLTKGYGGADLRALCTEAALNAIQRRYPQIYKSKERLLLKPETIDVCLRDFMISIKKLVSSSARSTSSIANPLPVQLVPLLGDTLDQVKQAIARVLPVSKKLTALEEAEFEEDSEDGALAREMLNQGMETLRIYRPRLVIHGPEGLGQAYVGAATLHHLEGYHIQSLELGTLLSDSSRTLDAAVVQLFVEAKRHQPSIVYIPSLVSWCAAVPESARSTVRSMLETLAPTDPVLLLAVVDGDFSTLPRDVRAWFGPAKENRVMLKHPSLTLRAAFFQSLLEDVRRPPNMFADGVKRRKRILEVLPIAPPVEPRPPTEAELAAQEESDRRIITLLKYRLGPILTELKRKFKRFTKNASEEYDYDFSAPTLPITSVASVEDAAASPAVNGDNAMVIDETIPIVNEDLVNGDEPPLQQVQKQIISQPPLHNIDLEQIHVSLYRGKYLTPQDFMEDIHKIVRNSEILSHRSRDDTERLLRAQAMLIATQVSLNDFDPHLRHECERMAPRERQRRADWRAMKDKEKASTQAYEISAGARRSGRHTGQEPEIPLTDPTKLERRLKRQRSHGVVSYPGSEEDGPDAKRSKNGSADEADLTAIQGSPQSRHPRVHFEADFGQRMLTSSSALIDSGTEDASNSALGISEPMSVDNMLMSKIGANSMCSISRDTSTLQHVPGPDPFISSEQSDSALTLLLQPPIMPENPAQQPEDIVPKPTLNSMEVHRTPSPAPDFFVDGVLFSNLTADLCNITADLDVEQLEQLRASCLGCVWRKRADWDRTALISELQSLVSSFVEEVAEELAERP